MAAREFLAAHARIGRRAGAVAAAAAMLGTASLAAVPAAQAATGSAHATVARASAPLGQAPLAIRCKIGVTLRFPHPLVAVGVVKCSGLVPHISIVVSLVRSTGTGVARRFSRSDARVVRGGIKVRCVSATYRASAVGKVRLRSGRVLTGHAATRRVRVSC